MKKRLCFILVLVLAFLCGCNNNQSNISAITKNLKFTAEINYNNEAFKFDFEIHDDGKTIMKAISPERIKNTVFELYDNNILIKSNKLEYKSTLENLPVVSPISFIYNVFKCVGKNNIKAIEENNQYFISGITETYQYKLFIGSSGLPIKIIDDKNKISAIITKVTICNKF